MSLDVVANDLSFVPATSKHEGLARMSELVKTLAECGNVGAGGALRYNPDLLVSYLSDGYRVIEWVRDRNVDHDTRNNFLAKATKSPFLVDEPDAMQRSRGYDFLFQGQRAEGLGAAYLLKLLTVSLPSSVEWNDSTLSISVEEVGEDGSLLSNDVELPHASTPSHPPLHATWIQRQQLPELRNGAQIWQKRLDLFPHLLFCASTEKQIIEAQSEPHLRLVIERLFELDAFARSWDGSRFDGTHLSECSAETATTMGNPRFRDLRTFDCPDGGREVFIWHFKLRGQNWRIYFLPRSDEQRFVIGYIGTHLASVRYPNL